MHYILQSIDGLGATIALINPWLRSLADQEYSVTDVGGGIIWLMTLSASLLTVKQISQQEKKRSLRTTLISFYNKVATAGVRPCYPEFLQRKIMISNSVILLLITAAGIPFIIISLIFYPPALWVPSVSVLFGIISIILNYFGFINIGRFFASFSPFTAAVLYNAYMSTAGEMLIASTSLLSLSFSLVPFLVFDLREKKYLATSFLLLLSAMMIGDYLNPWFEIDLDTSLMKKGYLSLSVTLVSILSCIGSILVLASQNLNSENRAEKLLHRSEEHSKELQKQQQVIQQKNDQLTKSQKELQQSMRVLQATQDKLAKQNKALEIEHVKTQEGLNYAKRIQFSILPDDDYLTQVIPESFILYKPKDIVSGDFYWLSQHEKKTIIAAVDCTGHGVPGALVSLIGNNVLNEAIVENKLTDPAKILRYIDKGLSQKLKHEEGTLRDGMDLGICVFEPVTKSKTKLIYGGAKNTLYVVSKGKLITLKGDRKSIGFSRKGFSYSKKELLLQKGDLVYLTTDGYIDQANADRERFGSVRFTKLLAEIHVLEMQQQRRIMEQALQEHQQETEQRDDINLIGIRV